MFMKKLLLSFIVCLLALTSCDKEVDWVLEEGELAETNYIEGVCVEENDDPRRVWNIEGSDTNLATEVSINNDEVEVVGSIKEEGQ